jgi:hypothetical protein
MANGVSRTGDMRIKLALSVMERVDVMAAEYGMPSATFCAFAIAEFLNQKEAQRKLTQMAVMDIGRRSLPQMEKALEKMLPALLAAMSSEPALLDGEAAKVA